jgi:hypothetical protein
VVTVFSAERLVVTVIIENDKHNIVYSQTCHAGSISRDSYGMTILWEVVLKHLNGKHNIFYSQTCHAGSISRDSYGMTILWVVVLKYLKGKHNVID